MNRATVRTLALDAIAAHRLTRLATLDVIFDGPRAAIIHWSYTRQAERAHKSLHAHLHALGVLEQFGAHRPSDLTPAEWEQLAMDDDNAPKGATFITCRWCASVWIGVGIVIARRWFPRLWDPVARAAAISSGAALLARVED